MKNDIKNNDNCRTLEGPLSGKSGHTIHGKPSHKRQEMTGYTNQSFSSLPEDFRIHGSTEIEISDSVSSSGEVSIHFFIM